MRVVIIPSDSFVSVDGMGYNTVDVSCVPSDIHAIQWYGQVGTVEYSQLADGSKPQNETIYSIEQFQPALDSWGEEDFKAKHPTPPPPTPPTAQENKDKASDYLYQTDWTQIPAISDPSVSTPHLTNAADFATYRNALRAIVFHPVDGFIDWPIKPNAVWAL